VRSGLDLRINRNGKFEYKTMKDTSDMLNSDSPRSWLIMGMNLLYKFNQNHDALVCFEKSLDLDPENLLVYQYKASALRGIGKNSEALKCYEKILSVFPNSAKIWKEKDMHHAMWTGNVDDIKKCCKKAIQLNPEDPWMYHYLIMILNDRKKQDESFGY